MSLHHTCPVQPQRLHSASQHGTRPVASSVIHALASCRPCPAPSAPRMAQLRGGAPFPGREWLEGVFDSVGRRLNVTSCEDLAQAVRTLLDPPHTHPTHTPPPPSPPTPTPYQPYRAHQLSHLSKCIRCFLRRVRQRLQVSNRVPEYGPTHTHVNSEGFCTKRDEIHFSSADCPRLDKRESRPDAAAD